MNLHTLTSPPRSDAAVVPGLPAVRLPAQQRAHAGLRGPQLGATLTYMGGAASFPPVMGVANQPSMSMQRLDNGGIMVKIRRQSPFTDNLTEADLRPLQTIANQILREAEALSQGSLTRQELARRHGPYGRGAARSGRRGGLGRLQGSRVGVSNLAVVNRQSGEFARSWSIDIQRDKNGVTLILQNDSPVAQYLALGTRRMRAHGPFTTAPARFLAQINREWLRLSWEAWAREIALQQVQSTLGARVNAVAPNA